MTTRREALRLLLSLPLAGALLPLAACGPEGPRAIRVGEEECAHCRMRISEAAFAAQLHSDRGRIWVFDSIECMVEWALEGAELPADRVAGRWVTDFEEPGRWLDAEAASYLRSDHLRSPMGLGLSAYGDGAAARAQQGAHGGDVLTWSEVWALVADTPVRGHGGGHAGMAGHTPREAMEHHGH